MASPRYLVTGGAGFIGSNIVAALANAGERVRVLDNLMTGSWKLTDRLLGSGVDVERITADIRDAEALSRAMAGVEVVFHEAADGSVPRSVKDPLTADDINTHGTLRVLEAARHAGVRRVLFAASSAVYGDDPRLPKREDMIPDVLSPYAVTKLAGEGYLRVYAELYGLETLNLRYFNVFGPNQLPTGAYAAAIPRFLDAALRDQPITIFGDGEQTRDFCFIDNVVAANLAGASSPKKLRGESVNVADGRRVVLNDLVAEIARVLEKPLDVRRVEPRLGDIKHSYADITRARELLGYEPRVPWEKGLAPTAAFLRENIASPIRP
jgi:UDP-glucose 4-epimerase